ncbi:MAG TPA: site-specific DNA-methyltransferase [Kofleriaceae bacterium]|nr:site-specific DNA-methyltransferase [Kofleriaceae bacterium]
MSGGGEAQQSLELLDGFDARGAPGPVGAAPDAPDPAPSASPPPTPRSGGAKDEDSWIVEFGRPGEPDRLVLGDSLDELAALGDGVLDAIYIDPPFGTGHVRHGRGHAYADRADDPEDFVAWLGPYLEHSRRALAPSGSVFVHLDYRAVHYVKVALDRLFGRDQFVNEIVWCYAVGGKGRRGFGRKHDTILWYARSADWAFYPEAVRVPRRGGSHMRVVDGVQEKTDRKTGRIYRYPVAAGKVPEDWWTDIETLNHSDRERTGWPSQKPERLVERLLRAVTVPGDRVADWFAGSGTTAAVAQRLGRGFVTVDREPAAIDLCLERLTRQGRQLASEGLPPPPLRVSGNKRRR